MIFEKAKLLPVALTEDETRKYGKVLATLHAEEQTKIQEMKEEIRNRKKMIETIQDEIARLSKAIRTESENRMVPVKYKADRERKMIICYRTDTSEFVNERPANPGELDKLFDEFSDDWQVPNHIGGEE
jgi:uncharacterized coiled-coil DUF342 family protein